MTAHPLLLTIFIIDLIGCGLILGAGGGSLRILLGWRPEAATAHQLNLERLSEKILPMAKLGLLLTTVSTLIFLTAVAAVLPSIVPGAMCGTGVLQNMGGIGDKAILLRGLLLLLLLAWHLVARIDAASPISRLTLTSARLSLLAGPIAVIAAYYLLGAINAVDIHTPVDCCATVYATAARAVPEDHIFSSPLLVAVTVLVALTLVGFAVVIIVAPSGRLAIQLTAPLAAGWVAVAAAALLRVFAPYHYGVLAHHCPWCLFLPDHRLVGYPLYLALFVVLAEGFAMLIASGIGKRFPDLGQTATRRVRNGAIRLLIAIVVFTALTVGPAVWWRFQFGVWIGGI